MNESYKPTPGELAVKCFLEQEGFDPQEQVKITNLKNDSMSYRVADFYLKKYNIYIEFLGKWNSDEESRNKYREKMKVYSDNNIPCVYIYPDNFGALEYFFINRVKEALYTHGTKWALFRFKLYLFEKAHTTHIIIIIGIILYAVYQSTYLHDRVLFGIAGVMFLALLYNLFKIIRGIFRYFIKKDSFKELGEDHTYNL